ncbi:MAG TPA: ATP-dependent DNA helicase UvrD2, partial [Candidatus Limnocylindrales bacterium]|nr:ATP-dependent DNA helicase UvrD2 [Candidatus Limnocylindrales bacterium]
PIPALLDSKLPILGRLARQLPGHYRFTPAKDLADEIEWAKSRRIAPRSYEREIARRAPAREPPIPVDLFVRTYEGYERAKARAGRIDFDDLLVETIDLLERDDDAAGTIRSRKRWFSVDEYQDTSPLQQRLLELWLGTSTDVCVVGDVDQTIYTFTGATSDFLTTFAERHPGARTIDLTRNYRSTPEVLQLANRLIAADGRSKRLVTARPPGPEPTITRYATAEEEMTAVVAGLRRLLADGLVASEVAVLVRMNAQLEPVEAALTRAGIAYQVRGIRFYDRPEIKAAIASLRRTGLGAAGGAALVAAIRRRLIDEVGFVADDADPPEGREAQERQSALETLFDIVRGVVLASPAADVDAVLVEVARRAAHERDGSADGVNLLTYHRAKGLEWDAVFLPMLEEGSLPIRQALDDDAALAEERRLLYVGITRARVHLALSWAARRETRGREGRREPSRFLLDVRGRRPVATGERRVRDLGGPAVAPPRPRSGDPDDPVFAALRAWRTSVAREEGMPPYVIAHDSTLAAIAEARPSSLAALRRVKGIGPAKLEKYGDGILGVLGAVD